MKDFILNISGLMTIFISCFGFMWYLFYVTEKRWESKLDAFGKKIDDIIKDQDSQRVRTDKLYATFIDLLKQRNL